MTCQHAPAADDDNLAITGPELVRHGDFAAEPGRTMARGWAVAGDLLEPALVPHPDHPPRRIQRLGISPTGTVTLSQSVAVQPGQTYLFTVNVRGSGRIVAAIDRLSLSYHRQGDWQQLVGLVRPSGKSLAIKFDMASLDGQSATAELDAVSLRAVRLPQLARRTHRDGSTTLVDAGQAQAAIVYPHDSEPYRDLARQLRQAIAGRCGVSLPLLSDVEATQADRPVLSPAARPQHLLVLGRLGVNRALWPSYNHMLSAVDGYYPGGDGYVVQTAANIYGDGVNHIILGGSSDAGAARAVERFIAHILPNADTSSNHLRLPWLHDIELGGAALAALKADDEQWSRDPMSTSLPPLEPGYGTVRRWYHNAMGFYWTGWDSYRQRMHDGLAQVLADKAYTHHYIAEFMVRVYDMLDDTGQLRADELAAMDNLILQNALQYMIGSDVQWMTQFSPPYDRIAIVNRHQISPWMADLKLAQFGVDRFELPDPLRALLQFRHSEKDAFLRHVVAERWGPSLPIAQLSETQEETVSVMFRYALEHELYDFFNTGRARRALNLEQLNHVNGILVRPAGSLDHALSSAILASYHRDGHLAWLHRNLPCPGVSFQGRHVAGVGRYTPGAELAAVEPAEWAGVRASPLMPHHASNFWRIARGRFEATTLSPQDVLDFVSFRSGFGKLDDYVAITGISGDVPPGAFLSFTSRGVYWFGSGDSAIFSPTSMLYYDNNALSVLRTDRWLGDPQEKLYASAARQDWLADAPGSGGVGFTLEPFMSTRWQRQVVWVRPGLYVVRDRVEALEPGRYELAINWRPQGLPAWDGTSWTSTTRDARLRITPLGRQFATQQNVESFRAAQEPDLYFRQVASASLQSGEARTSSVVLQATDRQEPFLAAQQVSDNVIALQTSQAEPTLVAFAPFGEGISSDANVLIVAGDRVQAMGGTQVTPADAASLRRLLLQQTDAGNHAATQADKPRLAVPDDRAAAQPVWTYSGLQRPARVTAMQRLGDDIIDLGRELRLAEIRSVNTGRFFAPAPMPAILTAAAQADGNPPPDGSAAWQPLADPAQWRRAVQTGNYGRADPVDQAYQVVYPQNLRARYVKAPGAHQLVYFDADTLTARHPLRIEQGSFTAANQRQILVTADVWPPFLRKAQEQTNLIAVLDEQGRQQYQFDPPAAVQLVRVLPPSQPQQPQRLAVLTHDAQLRLLDTSGGVAQHIDLYAMHQQFNQSHGRANTRQPAGGFTMPYNLGLWRDDRVIITRYGSVSFVDAQRRFEGVLATGGYVVAGMLDQGVDFDGDGVDEQVALGKGIVIRLGGDGRPRVRAPGSDVFYPEVYDVATLREPDFAGSVDGVPTLAMHRLAFGDGRRYVLVIRENYLGIYDGREHRWAFTWVPLARFRAGAAVVDDSQQLQIIVQSSDQLVWDLRWQGDLQQLSHYEAQPFDDALLRVRAAGDGGAILSGHRGVYSLADHQARLLVPGTHSDAQRLSGSSDQLITVAADGRVTCWRIP